MLEDLPSKTTGFKTLFLTYSSVILAEKLPLSSWELPIGSLPLGLWMLAMAKRHCTLASSHPGFNLEQNLVVKSRRGRKDRQPGPNLKSSLDRVTLTTAGFLRLKNTEMNGLRL